jgi:hypothetical protein
MIGVAVWLRTKKRSFAVFHGCPVTESQRISAFVPMTVNHSGGKALTIGPVVAGGAGSVLARTVAVKRPAPASNGTPAATAPISARRESPRRSASASNCSPRVSK